jgi:hypothetical protein
MKSLLTLLLIAAASIDCSAQMTLNSSTNAPAAGMSFKAYYGDSLSAGPAGANQVWNYGGFVAADSGQQRFVPCLSTPWCGTYAPATIAGTDGDGIYTYLDPTSSALFMHGIFDSSTSQGTVYTDPSELVRFPFTYGDSYVDTWASMQISGGVTYTQRALDSVLADAYGGVTLPSGNFNFTLRVKTISNIIDSATISGVPTFIGMQRVVSYNWYAINKAAPILVIGTRTYKISGSPTPIVVHYSSYTAQAATGVNGGNKLATSLAVYPNPAIDMVSVKFNVAERADMRVCLNDMFGRAVVDMGTKAYAAGEQVVRMDTKGLAAGVYFLTVNAGGERVSRKVEVR